MALPKDGLAVYIFIPHPPPPKKKIVYMPVGWSFTGKEYNAVLYPNFCLSQEV
jgi:hypothetical protein